MSKPDRVKLWDAINGYTTTCGGDPSKHVYGNTPRMDAVVAVERAVDDELATLRAENERLKVELAEANKERSSITAQAMDLLFERNTHWGTAESLRAQLREAQATIERLKAELAELRPELHKWRTGHQLGGIAEDLAHTTAELREAQETIERLNKAAELSYAENERLRGIVDQADRDFTELRAENERLKGELREATEWADARPGWVAVGVLRELADELRGLSDSDQWARDGAGLVYAAKELDRIADNAGAAPPEPAKLTVPALPIDERASAEIDKLVSAAGSGKRVQVARPGWVAASVLREVAKKWAEHGDARDFEYGQAVCAGELLAIADNAGNAEAVERAAFELVEERLRATKAEYIELLYKSLGDHEDGAFICAESERPVASPRFFQAGTGTFGKLYDAYRALAGKGGGSEVSSC